MGIECRASWKFKGTFQLICRLLLDLTMVPERSRADLRFFIFWTISAVWERVGETSQTTEQNLPASLGVSASKSYRLVVDPRFKINLNKGDVLVEWITSAILLMWNDVVFPWSKTSFALLGGIICSECQHDIRRVVNEDEHGCRHHQLLTCVPLEQQA